MEVTTPHSFKYVRVLPSKNNTVISTRNYDEVSSIIYLLISHATLPFNSMTSAAVAYPSLKYNKIFFINIRKLKMTMLVLALSSQITVI